MTGIKFLFAAVLFSTSVYAQDKYFTKTGKISFFSKAIIENIEAHNRSVTCVLDSKTGNVQFSVPIKGFEFEKALMQEHFNENYLESDKFPRGEFKGQIVDNNVVDYSKDGIYDVKVKGKLSIHGETNDLETEGKVTREGNKLTLFSEFNIRLPDYKIKNEKLQNISNTIKVTVTCQLDPLKT